MTKSIELNGQLLNINTNPEKGQGCYLQILVKTFESMTAILSYHCKIYVVQFSFNPYDFSPTNAPISRVIAVIKKRLIRRYKFSRIVTGWVRETGQSGIQHYHVALMMDGNKINRQGAVMSLITEILESRNFPAPHFTKPHMVKRGDWEAFKRAFYHLSYIAKVTSKGDKPKTTNEYSFSRLTCKKQEINRND